MRVRTENVITVAVPNPMKIQVDRSSTSQYKKRVHPKRCGAAWHMTTQMTQMPENSPSPLDGPGGPFRSLYIDAPSVLVIVQSILNEVFVCQGMWHLRSNSNFLNRYNRLRNVRKEWAGCVGGPHARNRQFRHNVRPQPIVGSVHV